MSVSWLGEAMVTDCSFLSCWKALLPIVWSVEGRETDWRLEQR